MKNKLYLECQTGISGDMTVAALLDLGVDAEGLKEALGSLNVDGFEIAISRVKKAGLDCCDFAVILDKEHENHDHDMQYLYGHEEVHTHTEHTEEHDHEHHDHHNHEVHEHSHKHAHHRNFTDIKQIIEAANLSARARKTAIRIFEVVAEAEAKAHGEDISKVHFHEVGAVDSIVDVVAIAYCLDKLDIEEVIVPYLCEGNGSVRCQHGVLPVPVPAVANITQAYGIALKNTGINGELVTPTGAAVVAATRTGERLPVIYKIIKTGLGAGKRAYERPSILRAMIIETVEEDNTDKICRLETNIDDCTGEQLGYVMDKLIEAGARDVHYIPVFMKKNRPAYELVVICDEADRTKLENIIFRDTTTIGIRRSSMDRTVLPRTFEEVETKYGQVKIKKCTLPDGTIRRYPEYESIKQLANSTDTSYFEILSEIRNN